MNKLYYIILILFVSCDSIEVMESSISIQENEIKNSRLLSIAQREGYRVMEVTNPWDTTKLLNRYILINKADSVPDNLPNGLIVRTPVNRIVAYTAVDIGSLTAINSVDKIVAVCEARYVVSPSIKEGLADGKIKDLGTYTKPNMELLASSNADVVFVSPFEGTDYSMIEQLGISVAECASYLEKTPLGRCEWIKFYAEFTADHNLADSIYNDIAKRFTTTSNAIMQKCENINKLPKILPDKRYGQIWYVASGDSYAANMYKAAGANYPWSSDKSKATIPLSFEEVFSIAHDADIWIFGYANPHGDITLEELKAEHSSYSHFDAYKNGGIYACNTELIPFYEESPLRPDLLLMDIAKMLHPKLFENHTFVYYKNIK